MSKATLNITRPRTLTTRTISAQKTLRSHTRRRNMMDVSCIVSDADDDDDPGSAESLISTGRCHVQINVEYVRLAVNICAHIRLMHKTPAIFKGDSILFREIQEINKSLQQMEALEPPRSLKGYTDYPDLTHTRTSAIS